MRKLLILLGIGGAAFLAYLLVSEVKKPAEGPVVVEEEVVVEDVVVTETATVTIEPTDEPDEPREEPAEEAEVFVPLKWDGKRMKKFAKDNGGIIVTINGVKYVKIGEAYYFVKNKNVYVRINNQILSI